MTLTLTAWAAYNDPMSTDHHHSHAPEVSRDNERRVYLAMWLTGGFMLAEVAGGIISGSLALIADAGHMATDTAALMLSWVAFRLSRKPADDSRSYGYHRGEVLAAFVNGIAMLALVAWILFEAVQRLLQPSDILGGVMLWVALGGLLVNVIAFLLLRGGSNENLNVRGAAVHVLGDLLGSVAAILAAGVILTTGWTPIDPLLSMAVALLVLRSAWFITRRSAHILMEGTPPELDADKIREDLINGIEGLKDVHHVHIWSLTQERALITLHAQTEQDIDNDAILLQINRHLRDQFNISHSTIQIEREYCP